jgi:hypothetical protein
MQANSAKSYSFETTPAVLGVTSSLIDGSALEGYTHDERTRDERCSEQEPARFHGSFNSCMEMYTDAATVVTYLDSHCTWFPRCAHPMGTEIINENGYALTIGRFGSFGYEVEPKIGLVLMPQDCGVYRIQTIPVPNYTAPGYEVDFRAALQLVEATPNPALLSAFKRIGAPLPEQITRVEWELDLQVLIQFPRFIQALPKSLVQSTGDRLLNQIVRQVSRRLTHKVQEDFHKTVGAAFPKKHRRC